MRILVTGLDGFTGGYVQSELEENGDSVVGLSCDLTDQNAVMAEIAQVRPEAVVHLAGIAFVGHGDANLFYQVNLVGTRNLLEALAHEAPDVRRILLVSSANIYGNRSEGILSEEAIPDPANDYAVSKCAMEQMARLWIDRLPLFIVRPFNYTGVGQDEAFLIPKIVNHFQEKSAVIELGNLDVWREFGDVRAVAGIYRNLLDCCPVGKVLNISTGLTYSLREVLALCEKITGHRIDIQVNPKFVRSNEVRVLTGDNSRLKSLLGELKFYSLEETLRWMLQEHSIVSK
ncbi:MAG: GDP-mannose 4,6-dehydratase [Candidatus Polarisedimenticolaceae bacterium]|nr:GDP-mannose 4,6-dehydratase [Candidatus Polarisedimenticolaceae bacterium]